MIYKILKYVEVIETLNKSQDKNNNCIFCNQFSINVLGLIFVYDTQREENVFYNHLHFHFCLNTIYDDNIYTIHKYNKLIVLIGTLDCMDN